MCPGCGREGKNMVQLIDRQRRDMSALSLLYIFLKEEVGIELDENIYDIPKRVKC